MTSRGIIGTVHVVFPLLAVSSPRSLSYVDEDVNYDGVALSCSNSLPQRCIIPSTVVNLFVQTRLHGKES